MAIFSDMKTLEATGESFSVRDLLDVRKRTRRAVHLIAEQVQPGMVEDEAKELARATLKTLGMRRGWHHVVVRFGPNTTKDFMERSDPDIVLADDDIFFIDIGPIYGNTEGDGGDTFVLGGDPEHHRAKRDVRQIWERVRQAWTEQQLSGVDMYQMADDVASSLRWRLNVDVRGHRLSEYPHSAHYDGALADVAFHPSPNRWVLEIAIAHPDRRFGALYEDLLLLDQSFPAGTFLF